MHERIRVARARAKLTMRDVAEACECSPQAVFKWEADESMPDSKKLMVLVRILDVSLEWLMDPAPLDFRSTERAPEGRHAKYWVREAIATMVVDGLLHGLSPTEGIDHIVREEK